MNWLKENWFKFGVLGVIFLLAGGCGSPQTTVNQDQTSQKPLKSSTTVQIPVTVLPTDDVGNGVGAYADKYPSNITVSGDKQLIDKVTAFGAAYRVHLGIKGWTGSGLIGSDGNNSVDLHPAILQPSQIGQEIFYAEIPACIGCMLDAAAPYFSNAQTQRNLSYNQDGSNNVTAPQGLQVAPISSTLITYTLPDSGGLSTQGVIYYFPGSKTSDPEFAEAKFVLPAGETDLFNFLIQNFISQGKYK